MLIAKFSLSAANTQKKNNKTIFASWWIVKLKKLKGNYSLGLLGFSSVCLPTGNILLASSVREDHFHSAVTTYTRKHALRNYDGHFSFFLSIQERESLSRIHGDAQLNVCVHNIFVFFAEFFYFSLSLENVCLSAVMPFSFLQSIYV